jgi:glycyl-tRNA synthetase alpha subunit
LGAWGLGWEVWLNGQEITQFTYFQQSGGMAGPRECGDHLWLGAHRHVPAGGKKDVWSIDYGINHSYGDLYRAEIEHCIYNFELADVDNRIRNMSTISTRPRPSLHRARSWCMPGP